VESAIDAVVLELKLLGCRIERKATASADVLWWTDDRVSRVVQSS